MNPYEVKENLNYNIESQKLEGKIGSLTVDTHAVSGGRAGSKAANELFYLANNSMATHIGGKHSKGTHLYGPIPLGLYYCKPHESRQNWIRLTPFSSNTMYGRSGFAIHGRGNTGSHGCLVMADCHFLKKMIAELENSKDTTCVLRVDAIGNPGWQWNYA